MNTQRNTTKEKKCNNDCFNCQYEDCILEEQDFPTGQHGQYKDKEKRKAYMREYFKKNGYKYRKTRTEYQANYYAEHKDELLARAKEKYRKQKEANNGIL